MNKVASIALPLLTVAGTAFGQAGRAVWPDRPVRVIIPYPPGGSQVKAGALKVLAATSQRARQEPEAVRARIVAEQKTFARAVRDAGVKPE
jgi:hypothetical protein